MSMLQTLLPGQRVEIQGDPIAVTLAARTGTVVRADEWDGYYIIRLDAPAQYHHANGEIEMLSEIVEAADNVVLLPPHR